MTEEDPRLAITQRVYQAEGHETGLVRRFNDDNTSDPGWPELAAEAVRAVNHLTSTAQPIPAPVVYKVLGELQSVGFRLSQACEQLADGLQRSVDQHDVYEDDGGNPAESAISARAHLEQAAAAAQALGEALTAAQAAIAKQGLRDIPADA